MTRRRERGSVSVLVVAVAGLGVLLALGVGRLGAAAVAQARADAAADASALAAADQLALGRGSRAAALAAAHTADSNGARLEECRCAGAAAEVVVVLREPGVNLSRPVKGRARAEVDLTSVVDRPWP